MPGLVPGIPLRPAQSIRNGMAGTSPAMTTPELNPGVWLSVTASLKHKEPAPMIRKLASGKYRLYSRKKNPKTGRRRNLGTFASRASAQKHERAVQFFKRG
jgi:hypothetical protein